MIYIIMIVEDTRREVRIPNSKRRRHTDIGSTIVGMRHRSHRLQKHTRMVHLVVRLVPGHVHVEHIVVVSHERQPFVIAREIEAVLLLRLEVRVTGLVLVLAVVVDAALKHDVDRTVLVQTIGEGKIQIILAVTDGQKGYQIPVAGTLFCLQHILLVIIGLLVFVSQTGTIIHASDA